MKTRKAYIQLETLNGEYLKPICNDDFVSPKIIACWNKCLANIEQFRRCYRSIHVGYCDENAGQIMAFAWINKTTLD